MNATPTKQPTSDARDITDGGALLRLRRISERREMTEGEREEAARLLAEAMRPATRKVQK